MAGTTPILALPYPTDIDYLANGDEAIQALAERVELRMSRTWLAYAQKTTNQTPIGTSPVVLSGLGVSVTLTSARRLMVTAKVEFATTGSAVTGVLYLNSTAPTAATVQRVLAALPAADVPAALTLVSTFTAAAGTLTVELLGARAAGPTDLTLHAGATYPAFLLLEDIGPATL